MQILSISSEHSISIGNFDMWVLNQNNVVCDLKINVTPNKLAENKENNLNLNEINEKIRYIMRENKIKEFYIDLFN